MGTDKRNRQKENRRARQTELEKLTQRQKVRRRVIRIAILAGIVVGRSVLGAGVCAVCLALWADAAAGPG